MHACVCVRVPCLDLFMHRSLYRAFIVVLLDFRFNVFTLTSIFIPILPVVSSYTVHYCRNVDLLIFYDMNLLIIFLALI